MLHQINLFNFIVKGRLYKSIVPGQMTRTYCSVPALKGSSATLFPSQLTTEEEIEVIKNADDPIIDFDLPNIPIPEYPKRKNETLKTRKHRLIYQSRKRGMLENDLILATFAAKYINDMSPELTAQYDELINTVTNEWDIFNWATRAKPTPPEYDNEIMMMLKEHVMNTGCEKRLRVPKLDYFNYI